MSATSETETRPGNRARHAVVESPAALPFLISAYFVVMLIPIEFSIFIGSLLITPMRMYLLWVTPIVYISFFSRRRFLLEDGLLITYASWVFLSLFVRLGASGIDLGGQRFLEISVSYMVARTFITERGHIHSMMKLLFFMVAILGVLAIPEAITHYRFLHEIPEKLTGFYYYISNDTRMQMLRAASTFEHPILFGLFSASSMTLLWYTAQSNSRRVIRTFFCGLASFFSLSSAAILVFGLQLILILMEIFTRKLPHRLIVFSVSAVGMIAFFELASNRGAIRLIASYLTFSAHTAYYRIAQWEYTIDDVFRHPIFGLHQSQWTRPGWLTDSIDNHWLFVAFQNGIPAVLALWALFLVIFIRVLRRARSTKVPQERKIEMAWIIAAIALFLGGWTVTYFGKMLPYFAFFLGLGSAIARLPSMKDKPDPDQVGLETLPPGQSRYTRFARASRSV